MLAIQPRGSTNNSADTNEADSPSLVQDDDVSIQGTGNKIHPSLSQTSVVIDMENLEKQC